MKEKKKVWTATISQEDHAKFVEVAEHKGTSMAAVLREHVRREHRKMQKEKAA